MNGAEAKRKRWTSGVFLFALLYSLATLFLADTGMQTGLDMDRYAFMESLVERGQVWVDESSMVSVDRIRIGEHFYSGKPPVMNFLGAGVYWLLHHGLGWSFRENSSAVVRAMIACFVSLPTGFLIWSFFRLLSSGRPIQPQLRTDATSAEPAALPLRPALFATLLLAFASLLLPYALIFTNHPLATALLFAAFALTLRPREPASKSVSQGLLIGLFAGFSATIDLIPGTFYLLGVGGAAVWQVWRRRRTEGTLPFLSLPGLLVGAAIPLLIHLLLNRITLGTWSTSYFVKDAFDYEGSIWTAEFDQADYDQFPTYGSALYHYLFGHRSVLLLSPLLAYGAWHAGRLVVGRSTAPAGPEPAARAAAWGALAALAGVLLLVPAFSMGLAGGVYGPRHVMPVLPLLYSYLPGEWKPGLGWGRRLLFWLVAAWSVVLAFLGTLVPWTPHTMSAYAPLDVIAIQLARRAETEPAEAIIRATAPNPAFGYQEMGAQLWGHGHREKALHAYLQSLKLQPTRKNAMYAAGVLAGEMGRLELAARMFRSLVDQDPENAGAWANLGVTLLGMGNVSEARPALERALALNPESRAALQGLLQVQLQGGEKEAARQTAERLLQVDPGNRLASEAMR